MIGWMSCLEIRLMNDFIFRLGGKIGLLRYVLVQLEVQRPTLRVLWLAWDHLDETGWIGQAIQYIAMLSYATLHAYSIVKRVHLHASISVLDLLLLHAVVSHAFPSNSTYATNL
jgi:hypothetical protein